MGLLTTCRTALGNLSRAAVKAARAKLRERGWLPESVDWAARAALCEQCPLRVVHGCGVSYCGKPFLHQVDRDPVLHGCGCPTHKKAKDPAEHCPITRPGVAATRDESGCNCKWCRLLSN